MILAGPADSAAGRTWQRHGGYEQLTVYIAELTTSSWRFGGGMGSWGFER